jgi:hypothetical protein
MAVSGLRWDDGVLSLFGPDITTTMALLDGLKDNIHLQPEKRLMLEMLSDAFRCLRKYKSARNRRGKDLYYEARAWVLSNEADWIFSFDNVCESLALDPDYLRRGLRRWTATTEISPKADDHRHRIHALRQFQSLER